MMIERQQQKRHTWLRRWWQAAFALLLTAVILFEAAPELRANALYLLTDGITTVVAGGVERVDESRILPTGAAGGTDVVLEPDRKVTIRRGESEQYATSRSGETVSALLRREGVSVGPLEMVRVDTSAADGVTLDIASDFTYYETAAEAVAYTTTYATDYTIPKGEERVVQAGQPGWRDVTYEVVYADGKLVSRQAVAEANNTSVPEIRHVGLLVKEAQAGDTIRSVVRSADGSGYLLMKSGDSLHFTGSMDVKCTAYTTGHDGVGTTTYTGTTVHVGVVAVDKSVIPLGTKMFITTAKGDYTYGMASAEDTGVRGKKVDLFMNTYNECMQFGARSSVVYFLDN